jgi:hypothetical protein
MLCVAESGKSLDRMAADLQHALTRHEFGMLGVHDLKQAISCSRQCLDAGFRRYWPPALPVATRGRRAA